MECPLSPPLFTRKIDIEDKIALVIRFDVQLLVHGRLAFHASARSLTFCQASRELISFHHLKTKCFSALVPDRTVIHVPGYVGPLGRAENVEANGGDQRAVRKVVQVSDSKVL